MVLLAATSVAAKDWHGIFPMMSTRADVERIFGLPKATKNRLAVNNGRWIYFLNQEEVHFVFAVDDFPRESACVTRIAEGTILRIKVKPMIQPLVSSLDIDEKKFSKFDPTFGVDPDEVSFINEADGLLIRASNGKVSEMIYVPSESDRRVCSGFYGSLEGLLLPPPIGTAFDDFGDIRFSDEKARLDNFAIRLSQEKSVHGFIIVYAGRKATVDEAQRRANRAKNYMVTVRGIESERIYAVVASYREELQIKLWVAPPGAEPPPLGYLLDPTQVQIASSKSNDYVKKKKQLSV